jgi:hypothetical protein
LSLTLLPVGRLRLTPGSARLTAGICRSNGIHSYACRLVHSELS